MKIIFLGDIVGKPGRQVITKLLPDWKKEHNPDLVIANGENMAHGSGFTVSGFEEVQKAGVDFFTSGNHWPRKDDGLALFQNKNTPIIRPANWVGNIPGDGYKVIEVGTTKVAIINLIGQIFMHEQHNSPFYKLDEILYEIGNNAKVIIVDMHAEVTSEKQAIGWHADGRVSVVVGTHTHVPTADARLLLKGTAYVTDLGMCGGRDGVIGDDREIRTSQFLDQMPRKHAIQEDGPKQVNSVVIDIDSKTGKANSIERLDEVVE
ncbi:TIGR00282 family metallophosphoesterase [bacterium]|jgi:hypothetical protein|nr:TIGR00282 family metallophosphoesterase [bacterium]|tara:strand:+ start:293 stop:1081 length:789 start_codon:yes stop_codon:yes gene_type:complete